MLDMATDDRKPPVLGDLTPPMVRRQGWYPDPARVSDLRWWDGDRWTHDVRPHDPGASSALETWGVVGGLLVPIVGVVIAIVLFSRNRVGPGLAALSASVLGAVIFLALTHG